MRQATEVPLRELLPATMKVINNLLNKLPSNAQRVGIRTDHSNEITGYKGVSAHLYSSARPGKRLAVNLQVTGPESLIHLIHTIYGTEYTAWDRQHGMVVFTIL